MLRKEENKHLSYATQLLQHLVSKVRTDQAVAATSLHVFSKVIKNVEVASRRRSGRKVYRDTEDVNVAGHGKLRTDQRRRQSFSRTYESEKVEHKDRGLRLGRLLVKVLKTINDFAQRQVLSDDVRLQDRVQS